MAPTFPPLTPNSLLERTVSVFRDRTAVVDGPVRLTYGQLDERTVRLARGLEALGVGPGDRVALLSPNTHVALEATLGVPRLGAVVVALNTRLSPAELAGIVTNAEPKVLIHDAELAETATRVAESVPTSVQLIPSTPDADDDYESLLASAPDAALPAIRDEAETLALNYTSGTTGTPKGAMYHHRGVFLQALSLAYHARLTTSSVYLWTLPMFHCSGWCFPWAVTAAGATHVCLRRADPTAIWQQIHDEHVTHLCAAPTVLSSIVFHGETRPLEHPVTIATGGAPPSPALLERAADRGIEVMHLYGLTETFGPATLCEWPPEWNSLDPPDAARRKARQGVRTFGLSDLRVVDRAGVAVPADGETMGELEVRGNTVMSGYFRNTEQTHAAVTDGWLRTGDLGVMHEDGYVEIRDRAKDVIISGGENITSIEVEQALASHDAVLEVAVVAAPHDHWGEVPHAFVELRPGSSASEAELIEHVRARLARYKAPKRITFLQLPRTATGKIQKFRLRASSGRPSHPGRIVVEEQE